jgi:hypothetical protein
MKLLTGNDLKTGDVIWWTGETWSRHVAEAADVDGHGEEIAAREEAARRVNAPYVIDGAMTAAGPQPGHIKDRMRAVGPSVRPDLALVRDPNAGSWTI